VPHFDADTGMKMDEIFSQAEAFLLGRTTYDIFSAHWPNVTDPNDAVATRLNTLPKFVASRTRTSFNWSGTSLIRDVPAEVSELKGRFAGEIQVHGSCGLAQTLIQNDLVDEYRLLTFPVILGTGKQLFGGGTVPAKLKLMDSRSTEKGIVISIYRRGGDFTTGTVALE
jgi:dihydrofolate reductase